MGGLEILARILEFVGGIIFFAGIAMIVLGMLFGAVGRDGCAMIIGGIIGFIVGAAIAGIGLLMANSLGLPYQVVDSSTGSTIIIVSIVIGIVAGLIIKFASNSDSSNGPRFPGPWNNWQ